jgi:glycosyltransferase involved in cell wall biosynthesis
MKIALVNDKYIHHEGGGAQESVRILAESLAARGHQVSVWATTYRPDQGKTSEIHANVKVTFLPIANVYWPHGKRPSLLKPLWHAIDAHNPIMAQRVGQLLDEEKPDILHTNILAGFSTAIWAEASRRNIPVVHTLRDYYLICPKGARFKDGGECASPCTSCRFYSMPKKHATRHVDAAVFISRHLSHDHFVDSPVREVIHNSYKAAGTLPPKTDAGGLKVGYLGRLFETKGIELLIEAIRQTDSAHLYIAGKGSPGYVEGLHQLAPTRTTFLGTVPPRSLFEKIDVLVVPSLWHEPFGRVAIEAMAWGIPVIASQRGGLPEIVQSGVNGWLFEPDEKDSLTRFLRSLNPETCRSMRDACLERSRAFLPEVITAQYEQLYARVLLYRQTQTIPSKRRNASPSLDVTAQSPTTQPA